MTLVVLAAGLGSRFGGYKQMEGFGPHGELLMEYSVFDAVRAGFDKVVFIIKDEMQPTIERLCGEKLRKGGVKVSYAAQDKTGLPGGYTVPEGRTKPFGTVHALLSAEPYVDEPFAIINADDYYGAGAYTTALSALRELEGKDRAFMIAYRLKNTVSSFGEVTRGVCMAEEGELKKVTETYRIRLLEGGEIRSMESGETLDGESLVSMNLWGFGPDVFGEAERYFESFLSELPEGELKKECVLPNFVDSGIKAGSMAVKVLETDEKWFGVTYREDKPQVCSALSEKHENGEYPDELVFEVRK